MDNVEVYNCSQMDTQKAAIRFESSINGYSSITNSAFHQGLGWGLTVLNAAHIFLQGNVWYDFSTIGANIMTSNNITIDSNILFNFPIRSTISMDESVDPSCALAVCTYNWPDYCSGVSATNNILAGAIYVGIAAIARKCGDTSDLSFKNNVAHSIRGTGAIVAPDMNDPAQTTCFEGSDFTAYKNTEGGFIMYNYALTVQA